MKIIIFQGVISWAEEVGVEVGKGRVEVVGVDQVEVEVEVVEVVEEEEEVVEVEVVVDLRNNARHLGKLGKIKGQENWISTYHAVEYLGVN